MIKKTYKRENSNYRNKLKIFKERKTCRNLEREREKRTSTRRKKVKTRERRVPVVKVRLNV